MGIEHFDNNIFHTVDRKVFNGITVNWALPSLYGVCTYAHSPHKRVGYAYSPHERVEYAHSPHKRVEYAHSPHKRVEKAHSLQSSLAC